MFIKTSLTTILLLAAFSLTAYAQNYLDKDKRYMEITEVSIDKSYGFKMNNPVKVGADEHAIGAYLNSLKPPDCDRIHIGDMKFNYKDRMGLTIVLLTFEKKKEKLSIYFSFLSFEQPKALAGFSFKTIDEIPKAVVFPADSIATVTACAETIYAVDDFLLKEKIGAKPAPTAGPTFRGGIEELKKYFLANPLTDERVQKLVFRVGIGFLVNCQGKAGSPVIVTKGRGDLETFANQVLAVVNKMPQNWQAATVDGKTVDSYQVLSFTVLNGQLDRVSCK